MVMLAFILLGANISCGALTSAKAEDGLIQGFGRTTFAALGWDEDVVLSADSSQAAVKFRLPTDASQGEELWYAVRLKFQWYGSPGELGEYAFLNGRWNGKAFYQFQTKKMNNLDAGFRWSLADAVNGYSMGHELTPVMDVASTNVAQYEAIKGGDNELVFSLGLRDASNKEITAVISKESEVVVTSWRPPIIKGKANAQVNDNTVDVEARGQNLGWGAPSLKATVLMWSGRKLNAREFYLGPLPPLGKVEFSERIVLEEGRVPHRVDVEFDWGSGKHFYIAWDANAPKPPKIPLISGGFFRSTIGLMAAVAVLWVVVPALVASVRLRRRR